MTDTNDNLDHAELEAQQAHLDAEARDAEGDIETRRAEALLDYLRAEHPGDNISGDDISPQSYDSTTFDTPGREYRVLTDDEAGEALLEYVADSLWAFNARFLANYMPEGIGEKEINDIRGDRCEDANAAMLALAKAGPYGDEALERIASDAASDDGRGHFLSGWDGEEIEHSLGGQVWYLYAN